jgi:hypothetical protein
MIQKIFTGTEAMTLKVSVSTTSEQDIRLIVRDSNQANTVLTDRFATVNGNYDFYVMMPLCRNYVDLIITNDKDGSDSSFTYNGFKKVHLDRRMMEIDFTTYYLNEYLRFIQKFCYNAGILPANDPNNKDNFYRSTNLNPFGKPHFYIKYLPSIVDSTTGEELETPARIAEDGSFIEISQKFFIEYSVPMRIAVLLHEYAHPFINSNPDDEGEADFNGLFIYLALGYPRIEGGQAWCEVAMNTPTDENLQRVADVDRFINDFDKSMMVIN